MFLVDDDGTITMDLSNFSGKYKRYSTTTYYAVENTTSQYTVGISGGYYYYNAVTRKNLSKAIGTLVIFNFN